MRTLDFPAALPGNLRPVARHRTIEFPSLQQIDRTYVRFRGRKLSYFSGCDYFRLSQHPRVQRALQTGLNRFGLNVAASRITTGNHRVYTELERRLAQFFGRASAVVVSSGYVANLAAAQAMAGRFDLVLLDERAHASLEDAARMITPKIVRFRHRDPAAVRQIIGGLTRGTKPVLLTDGMFSHDGSVAPLAEYLRALPRTAQVLVDDAHAAGVLGAEGRGTIEFTGGSGSRVVQTVTLSKAFGVYGGAILGTQELRSRILEHSRVYAGNTPLPLPLVSAAVESLRVFGEEPRLRSRLVANATCLRRLLAQHGFPLTSSTGPLLGFVPSDAQTARQLSRGLLRHGVYPPFIRYPGGPAQGYFRFALSSEHSRVQLDALAEALIEFHQTFRQRTRAGE